MSGFTAFGSRKTHAFPEPLKAGGNSSEFCKGNGERRAAPAESVDPQVRSRHRGGQVHVNRCLCSPCGYGWPWCGDPGSKGGRGPEVLLSLLPRVTTLDYRRRLTNRQRAAYEARMQVGQSV